MKKETKLQKSIFVVSPIGGGGSDERKHADMLYNGIIEPVAKDKGYRLSRADTLDRPGMINDQVITSIVESDVVVADLSFLNPNVFYELGVRHAAKLPTIHVAREGTKLPFDNIGYRAMFVDLEDWHSHQKLRVALGRALDEVAQPDFKISNPITQANALQKIAESDDPGQELLFELERRIANLENYSRPSHGELIFEVSQGRVMVDKIESSEAYLDSISDLSILEPKYGYQAPTLMNKLKLKDFPDNFVKAIRSICDSNVSVVNITESQSKYIFEEGIPF